MGLAACPELKAVRSPDGHDTDPLVNNNNIRADEIITRQRLHTWHTRSNSRVGEKLLLIAGYILINHKPLLKGLNHNTQVITIFPSALTVAMAYPRYLDVHMCNVLAASGLAKYGGLSDSRFLTQQISV